MPSIRAAVMPAPFQPLQIVDLPTPTLEPGAALLRTIFSEVCGTDVHLHHGRLTGVPYPFVPGHVSVGRIEQMRGHLVDVDGHPFRIGDVVTFLDVHETCGHCHACAVSHQVTRCPSRKVYGITYGAQDGPLGGWAEQIWIKPGVKLLRLPVTLAPETFIGGGCGLVTAVHAIDRADVRLAQTVVVLGAGPVGQSLVALARLSGANEVIAIDAAADRLAFAERMGADLTIALDITPGDREAIVRQRTGGRGADVVIEATGSPQAVSDGLDLLRDGGRLVVCGHYTDHGPISVHPHFQINRKHVEIRGVWGSDYSHFHRAVSIAARHGDRIPWREMVSAVYPLDKAGEALAAVERKEVLKALIAPNG